MKIRAKISVIDHAGDQLFDFDIGSSLVSAIRIYSDETVSYKLIRKYIGLLRNGIDDELINKQICYSVISHDEDVEDAKAPYI